MKCWKQIFRKGTLTLVVNDYDTTIDFYFFSYDTLILRFGQSTKNGRIDGVLDTVRYSPTTGRHKKIAVSIVKGVYKEGAKKVLHLLELGGIDNACYDRQLTDEEKGDFITYQPENSKEQYFWTNTDI